MSSTADFATGLQALLPMAIMSAGALLLMMQIAFKRHEQASWIIGCLTLLLSALAVFPAMDLAPRHVTPLLVVDDFSLFFTFLFVMAGLVTALLARDYLRERAGQHEEFYLLVILATMGALVLVAAVHLATFLLGLELLGVSLYALVAYPERRQLPLEAAVKYLVLSGAASAILLFGFALIYAVLGTLSFTGIGESLYAGRAGNSLTWILVGSAMAISGIGFKLSLVPFHMWTPDVYHGAPAPVTGFLATVSKGAIFVALLRFFLEGQLYNYQMIIVGLTILAIASMLVGNLLALRQDNLKRLLAYSSIAHLGYLLTTLIICGAVGNASIAVEASGYYLVAYLVTTLAAFALIAQISGHPASSSSDQDSDEHDTISSVKALFWRQPMLASLLTVTLLSLAGIPLTVGFIGKFYIFTLGVEGSLWALIAALIVGSGIGIYYYLRVIFAMTQATDSSEQSGVIRSSSVSHILVVGLIFLMLWLGINPQTLMLYLSGLVVG